MTNEPAVKPLKIKVEFDTEIEKSKENLKKIFEDSEYANKIADAFGEAEKKLEQDSRKYKGLTQRKKDLEASLPFANEEEQKLIKEALKTIQEEIEKTFDYQKDLEKEKDEKLEEIYDTVDTQARKLADNVEKALKSIYKNVKNTLDDMASYNVSGSIYGTSTARQTMLQYGTSEAETYGLSKTKEILGLNSEDDLWYMNQNQREKFAELMGRYTSKYQELANKDFFKKYEEFKLEFELLKEELTYELIDVIIDNKDVIIQFLNLGVEAMKGIINFFGNFAKMSNRAGGSVSDVMSSYVNNTSSNSQSYSFNNTFNVSDLSSQSAQLFSANMINTIKQLTQS